MGKRTIKTKKDKNKEEVVVGSLSMKTRVLMIIGTLVIGLTAVFGLTYAFSEKKLPDSETVAGEINGKDIYFDEVKFYAYSQQAVYEARYVTQGQEIEWSADAQSGGSLQTLVIAEAMLMLKKNAVFVENKDKYDVELSKEDKDEIKDKVDAFLKESDKDLLNKINANKDVLLKIYEDTKLYEKIIEKLVSAEKIEVSKEEAKQAFIYAVKISSANNNAPLETANKIFERVQKGENIEEVASVYGLVASGGNIGINDMEGNDFEKLALSLKTGESGMTKVDTTYYVAFCKTDYDEEATNIAIKQKESDLKNEIIQKEYEKLLKTTDISLDNDVVNRLSFEKKIFTFDDIEEATSTEETTTTKEATTTQETTTVEEKTK